MATIEKGFIPIAEAQNERVHFQVNLPEYVNEGRIGVNLKEIQRLCQIGGIRNLVVLGIEDLDTSKVIPQILGQSRGEAYMGKAVSKLNVPPTESFSSYKKGAKHHLQEWSNALITVNMSEVSERITNDKRWIEGVRSTNAWSHYLNKGIKDGISSEGISQLLTLRHIPDFVVFAVWFGFATTNSWPIIGDPHLPNTQSVVANYFGGSLIWNLCDRFLSGERPFLKDGNSRYSMFYGPEVDRALLLKILTKTKTLVKQI